MSLRVSDPAAKRDIDADAAVLIHHFFGAFQGEFRSVDALPCKSQFQGKKFDHCSASIAVVPSIVNPFPMLLFRPEEVTGVSALRRGLVTRFVMLSRSRAMGLIVVGAE